jgi:outer membrane protein assembly factor BamE (lipoprotein component of BamABCDE complex)
MKLFTTLFCVFLFLQTNAQVWDRVLTDSVGIKAISPTSDGGSIIIGNRISTQKVAVIKVNALGQSQWVKDFTDMTTTNVVSASDKVKINEDSDGNFWIGLSVPNASQNLTMAKLDKNGNRLLLRTMTLRNAEINVLTNQLVVIGVNSSNITTILRLKPNGDTLNIGVIPTLKFTRSPYYVSTTKNDGLILYHISDSLPRYETLKLGFDGTVLARTLMPTLNFPFITAYPLPEIVKMTDGNLLVPDSSNLIKLDSEGQFIWRKPIAILNPSPTAFFFGYMVAPTLNGGFIQIKHNPSQRSLEIRRFAGDGVQIGVSFGFYTTALDFPKVIRTAKGGFVLAGSVNGGKVHLIKLEENGYFYSYFIKGKVFGDGDNTCKFSSGDVPIQRVIVTAKRAGFPDIYSMSDSLGDYNLNADAGTYTVAVVKPNKYMTPCTPSVIKTIGATNLLDSFDFPLKSDFLCGLMQVDVSTPRLRRCFNNNYTVNYCNNGTATALGAYVNITIDSLLEFISADKPFASRTGRTYRFNLGDVPVNDCRTFDIVARVRCGDSTRLNQTLCVEAKIYPDTICEPLGTLWSGANLSVNGTCQGDSVIFQVRNIGRAASVSSASMVVENLNSTPFNVPALAANGVFTKKYPANGNTWRMIVNQEPNNPRSTQPTAFVEGCRRAGVTNFTTGFGSSFANDDADVSLDIDCQPIVGAFDPNDKIGYPLGTGTTRAIGQNQDIDYMIRFQNTGTDTAFTVVIRDTIDIATLDLTSIEWGASSHKYKPEIYKENVVKFTFDNILLVDSFTNEPKSNGYVKFRIKQKKDVAFGTKIQNSAGIYFDFNDPVLTNKTLHTVSKAVVTTATIDKSNGAVEAIKVFPNPASETMFFELKNTPLPMYSGQVRNSTFELYDLVGKRLITQEFSGKIFEFHRQSIPSGIYLFKISDGNKIIGTGKLVIN